MKIHVLLDDCSEFTMHSEQLDMLASPIITGYAPATCMPNVVYY